MEQEHFTTKGIHERKIAMGIACVTQGKRIFTNRFWSFVMASGVLLLLALSIPLSADTLKLKNGQTLEGRIVGQSRTTVRLRLPNGRIKVVPKKSIKIIRFGEIQDPNKELERKKREEEARRRKEQEQKRLEKKRLEEEKRKKEEARRIELERRAKEARQKEQERKRRLAEERRRREKNRYHPPKRHWLSLRLGMGQAYYHPLAPALVENFYQTVTILSGAAGSNRISSEVQQGNIFVQTQSRLQSLGLRYTWNAFFADLSFRGLQQKQSYAYRLTETILASNTLSRAEFGSLRDPDPLIEMTKGVFGWRFWESPSMRLALVLGYRRDLLRFSPEGIIVTQSQSSSLPIVDLPVDFGYLTKSKGVLLGLEWELQFSGDLGLRAQLALLRQSGIAKISTAKLKGSVNSTNGLDYRPNGFSYDLQLQRRGFEALLEGRYRLLPSHFVGLRLGYWELRSSHRVSSIKVFDTDSRVGALQLALLTRIGDGLSSALLPEHRALERSLAFFYEWRYSFL